MESKGSDPLIQPGLNPNMPKVHNLVHFQNIKPQPKAWMTRPSRWASRSMSELQTCTIGFGKCVDGYYAADEFPRL